MEGRTRLESWKEISSYLKRSIKTCQRWEIELDLPIHRLDGTPSARVFADPAELDAWLAEKLNSREAEVSGTSKARRRKRNRWALALATVFVLAASGVIASRFLLSSRLTFPRIPLASVAFLPFENVTRDATLELWRFALPRLLVLDLQQSRLADASESSGILAKIKISDSGKYSSEDLRNFATKTPVEYFVTGSLINSGRDFIIDMTLYKGKSAVAIQSFRATSRAERGVFREVDRLTRELKLGMGISSRLVSRDIDSDVGQIATDSPEAFKHYCRGVRLEEEGKVEEAVEPLRKAVQIDPEFCEAYYHLFTVYESLVACCPSPGDREEAIRSGEKALEYSDRLSVRSRADLIDRYLVMSQRDFERALTEYERLIRILGDDPATLSKMAKISYDLEDYDKAISWLEKVPPFEEGFDIQLLADCYVRVGRPARANELLSRYLDERDPRDDRVLYALEIFSLEAGRIEEALAYNDRIRPWNTPLSVQYGRVPIFITQDDSRSAEVELQRIVDLGMKHEQFEGRMGLAGLNLAQGKLDQAAYHARSAIDAAPGLHDWPAVKRAHSLMAYLEILRGDLAEALREAELACPCYQEDDFILDDVKKIKYAFSPPLDDIHCLRYLHQRALITLTLGRAEEFEKQAAEIKRIIDQGRHPKLVRIYYHLLGRRELMNGNASAAIGLFWKALVRLPSPRGHDADIDSAHYFYSLAEAYELGGRCRTALDIYRKVPSDWRQRLSCGDLYARAYYRMARIYDRCGRPAGTPDSELKADRRLAIENYRRFLALWKDADPVFKAEVEDAARRLAALEAEMASAATGPAK